jgi:Dak1 domain
MVVTREDKVSSFHLILYNAAYRLLDKHGITAVRSLVGSYVMSLEMAGASITVSVLDHELYRLWDAPVHTAALRWIASSTPRSPARVPDHLSGQSGSRPARSLIRRRRGRPSE